MVRGVTTAATIWVLTVIGLCFGGGQIGLGAVGTVIALTTLWLLKYMETTIVIERRGTIDVTFSNDDQHEPKLLALLAARGFARRTRRVELVSEGTRIECSGRYNGTYPDWSSALVRDLAAQPGASRVEWRDID
jgi:putative Mg2+ transporter-C (MgtC) family protein